MAVAQQLPITDANTSGRGPVDASKLAALKKKLTDGIDVRIGKLEALEECIQAAPDLKVIKDCRQPFSVQAADSKD